MNDFRTWRKPPSDKSQDQTEDKSSEVKGNVQSGVPGKFFFFFPEQI